MNKKLFTIFPSPSLKGLSFTADARALGTRLGYAVEVKEGEDALVVYYAPFEGCERVGDYGVVWGHFSKEFKN